MSTGKTDQNSKKAQQKDEKFDKYLTDIKELPPTAKEEVSVSNVQAKAKEPEQKNVKAVAVKEESKRAVIETKEKESRQQNKDKKPPKTKYSESQLSEETDKPSSIFTFKDIILGIINIISIALIIFLLFKLPQKAIEFQTERIEGITNQVSPQSEFGNINDDSEKAAKLDALFLDESGVVNFVSDVEKLKPEYPAISKVTFASPKTIKDEIGLVGIPVTIELRGGWESFKPALEKIQGLPYLFRPISVNAGPSKDDPSVLVLDYGVFLYVNNSTHAE